MGAVYVPPQQHHCRPGVALREVRPPERPEVSMGPPPGSKVLVDLRLPAGTVWECECGELYRAFKDTRPGVFNGVVWHRMGRWARRRWRKRGR